MTAGAPLFEQFARRTLYKVSTTFAAAMSRTKSEPTKPFNFYSPESLLSAFLAACQRNHEPASRVLRQAMRAYLEQQGGRDGN